MDKRVETRWTISAKEVKDAIRSRFGIPCDASITVNIDGSVEACRVVSNDKSLSPEYIDYLLSNYRSTNDDKYFYKDNDKYFYSTLK